MAETKQVKKRDGRVVPFTQERITNAIYRAAVAVGGRDRVTARKLSDQVVAMVDAAFAPDRVPTVEDIQDMRRKGFDREWSRPGSQGLHSVSG